MLVEGDKFIETGYRVLLTRPVDVREFARSAVEQTALPFREEVDARIASLERSVGGLRQLIEQRDRKVSVAEPVSPDAAAAKSSGRIALDLRAEEIARDVRRVR